MSSNITSNIEMTAPTSSLDLSTDRHESLNTNHVIVNIEHAALPRTDRGKAARLVLAESFYA